VIKTIAQQLIHAEALANELLQVAEVRNYFVAHQTEKELNDKLYALAFELFGIKKYWHKRIVRCGPNTLLPYKDNPPNLTLQTDDILFVDFGPVFEDWEADVGKTYVIGNSPHKLKLQRDVELAWQQGRDYYIRHSNNITCAELYNYTQTLAQQYGWRFTNEHCGHLIGNFPHEILQGETPLNYIMSNNTSKMSDADLNGNPRHWIYEIHFIDEQQQIGGFYERYLV
jgi:Xaa-Pro dipeptidase